MKTFGEFRHGWRMQAFCRLAMLLPVGLTIVLFRVFFAFLDDALVAALGVALVALFGILIAVPGGTRNGRAAALSYRHKPHRP